LKWRCCCDGIPDSELLDNPERMEAMGQAARQRVTKFFDLGLVVKRIESIISDTLRNAGY